LSCQESHAKSNNFIEYDPFSYNKSIEDDHHVILYCYAFPSIVDSMAEAIVES